jgi:hypothetical protein
MDACTGFPRPLAVAVLGGVHEDEAGQEILEVEPQVAF